MKEITAFENIDRSKSFEEQGLNGTSTGLTRTARKPGTT